MVMQDSIDILKTLDVYKPEIRQGTMLPIGAPIPGGLNPSSASAMELPVGTPIATGIVDGLGGSLASLDPLQAKSNPVPIENRLSIVVGTSTIYIASSQSAKTIEGAWGPIPSALGGIYHNIVGQSAAGALIDHIVSSHPAHAIAIDESVERQQTISHYLNETLKSMAEKGQSLSMLTHDIHLLPYFAGNRCPKMDMSLKEMVIGLELDKSIENLALTYLACIQAIALGARHNIELLTQHGYHFTELRPCGGLAKNPLFIQEHVNIAGIQAKMPQEPDCMLLSSALVASVACGVFASIEDAIQVMSHQKETVYPDTSLKEYYDRKYRFFLELYEDQQKYRKIMNR
ncbi:FGGY-family carbohydrate kinase [Endozoicomonas numazuensis]|uniref:FGGY-family carbohydrate kinase n=1 Tax=Endozoicomonas numazuensis TaxID=1137799 RepID=UPI00068D5D87|nr:FGGY-family carbohydrate kinase [Endozoicomonas numazuensis]